MQIFTKLKELNLSLGQYVVVGSGLLAALGIREANDLDIAVTKELFKKLTDSNKFQAETKYGRPFLTAPLVEIIGQLDWSHYQTKVKEAIRTAYLVNGYPFLNFEETIKFKKALGREKDFRDIKLLEDYLDELDNCSSCRVCDGC